MAADAQDLTAWLANAAVPETTLTDAQRAVLQAAFAFLARCGRDYYSVRLLSHVLLHSNTGLKVAHIARLLGLSRSAASAQQGLASKAVVQAAHHRLSGRSHGKLLPRFAGPIAHYLHQHPDATRWDLLDFLQRTWGVSVSRMALHRFLKKYGLDQASRSLPPQPPADTPDAPSAVAPSPAAAPAGPAPHTAAAVVLPAVPFQPADQPRTRPPAAFFLPRPATPARS